MKKTTLQKVLLTLVGFSAITSAAVQPDGLNNWQLNRLLHPTVLQLEQEQGGEVFIYDGMRDHHVIDAVDSHFDRIQNMMFVGVLLTDSTGQLQRDPVTDEPLAEEDNCD